MQAGQVVLRETGESVTIHADANGVMLNAVLTLEQLMFPYLFPRGEGVSPVHFPALINLTNVSTKASWGFPEWHHTLLWTGIAV